MYLKSIHYLLFFALLNWANQGRAQDFRALDYQIKDLKLQRVLNFEQKKGLDVSSDLKEAELNISIKDFFIIKNKFESHSIKLLLSAKSYKFFGSNTCKNIEIEFLPKISQELPSSIIIDIKNDGPRLLASFTAEWQNWIEAILKAMLSNLKIEKLRASCPGQSEEVLSSAALAWLKNYPKSNEENFKEISKNLSETLQSKMNNVELNIDTFLPQWIGHSGPWQLIWKQDYWSFRSTQWPQLKLSPPAFEQWRSLTNQGSTPQSVLIDPTFIPFLFKNVLRLLPEKDLLLHQVLLLEAKQWKLMFPNELSWVRDDIILSLDLALDDWTAPSSCGSGLRSFKPWVSSHAEGFDLDWNFVLRLKEGPHSSDLLKLLIPLKVLLEKDFSWRIEDIRWKHEEILQCENLQVPPELALSLDLFFQSPVFKEFLIKNVSEKFFRLNFEIVHLGSAHEASRRTNTSFFSEALYIRF